jgi:hypothetical protein
MGTECKEEIVYQDHYSKVIIEEGYVKVFRLIDGVWFYDYTESPYNVLVKTIIMLKSELDKYVE